MNEHFDALEEELTCKLNEAEDALDKADTDWHYAAEDVREWEERWDANPTERIGAALASYFGVLGLDFRSCPKS